MCPLHCTYYIKNIFKNIEFGILVFNTSRYQFFVFLFLLLLLYCSKRSPTAGQSCIKDCQHLRHGNYNFMYKLQPIHNIGCSTIHKWTAMLRHYARCQCFTDDSRTNTIRVRKTNGTRSKLSEGESTSATSRSLQIS